MSTKRLSFFGRTASTTVSCFPNTPVHSSNHIADHWFYQQPNYSCYHDNHGESKQQHQCTQSIARVPSAGTIHLYEDYEFELILPLDQKGFADHSEYKLYRTLL